MKYYTDDHDLRYWTFGKYLIYDGQLYDYRLGENLGNLENEDLYELKKHVWKMVK